MRDVQVSVDETIIETAKELAEQIGKEIFVEFGKHKATKPTTKEREGKMVFSNSTQTYNSTEEKYKQKQWSTFLMKPERPSPKPKKVVEEEKQTSDGYKIIIKKQSRRKTFPKEKRVQFDQNVLEIEHEAEINSPEDPASPELDSLEEFQPNSDILDKENLEQEEQDDKYSNSSEQCSDCEVQDNAGSDDESGFERLPKDSMAYKPISEIIVDPCSDNAMTLEERLRTVQKQLQALSELPSAVQVTLDAVSKQIAEIFSENDDKVEENDTVDEKEEEDEEEFDGGKDMSESMEAAEADGGDDTNSMVGDELEEDSLVEKEIQEILGDGEIEEKENLEELARIHEKELEEQRIKEELLAKKEKEMEDKPKPPTFRPIVLPGGRKWIDPDDVVPTRKPKMSDEKIMESIEGSLEVIAGKRKGINFMKYTPPPRNLDHLQRSEVYRLIHSNETSTTTSRGIVGRPEKILPEQDYYEATRSQQ